MRNLIIILATLFNLIATQEIKIEVKDKMGYGFMLNDSYRGFQLSGQTYGWARGSYHDGIDLGSTFYDGRNILAVGDGEVIAQGNYGGEIGCYVVLLIDGHQMMYQEYEMNGNTNTVKKGDKVNKGDKIASWGNGSHVHFGVLEKGKDWERDGLPNGYNDNGTWLDPISFLTGGKANGEGPVSMSRPTGTEAKRLEELFTKNENGGGGEGGGNGGGETGGSGLTLVEVASITEFKPIKHEIKGILKHCESLIQQKTGIKNVSPQLLTNEFVGVFIEDYTGNKTQIDINRLTKTEKNNVNHSGVIGDNNLNMLTVIELLNTTYDEKVYSKNYALYSDVFIDNSTRNIPIISNQINTLMQSSSNSLDSQRASFRENKKVLDEQIKLNNQKASLSENRNNYNAQFGVEMSDLGFLGASFGLGSSLVGTAMGGFMNPLGAINSLVGSGMGYYGGMKSTENARQQRDFTYQGNDLNNQQVALSNMSAKQSYYQQLRGFNASIKDVKNAPDSMTQTGSDISYLTGNKVDTYFISYYLPQKELLIQADNYIKMYGSLDNDYYNKINSQISNISNYKFIQCVKFDIDNVNMNFADYITLQSIFLTGVRLWKYDETLAERFMKYDTI